MFGKFRGYAITASALMGSAFVVLLYKVAGNAIINMALAVAPTVRSSWLVYEADVPKELQ